MPVEGGHGGVLVSLGGVVDRTNRGRRLFFLGGTIGAATRVLANNPGRLWATFNNDGPSDCGIAFDNSANYWCVLKPGGTAQIDNDTPWTGEVWAASVSSSSLYVVEASTSI